MAVHSASPSGPIVDRACFVPPLQTLVKPMVHVILTFILLLHYCCNKKYAWVLRPMAYLKFKIQLSISRWSHGNIDSYFRYPRRAYRMIHCSRIMYTSRSIFPLSLFLILSYFVLALPLFLIFKFIFFSFIRKAFMVTWVKVVHRLWDFSRTALLPKKGGKYESHSTQYLPIGNFYYSSSFFQLRRECFLGVFLPPTCTQLPTSPCNSL